ncbi:MAG: hypothetical protein QNJ16_06235 [Rhodobacter sp.]|nr:hypothetical protein [Rhodobacter sp.]
MDTQSSSENALYAARCIADLAVNEGVLDAEIACRPTYDHMGAVLADSVLQAGLNYSTVVKPRVHSILQSFPHARTVNVLVEIIALEGSGKFLQWAHHEKTARFEALVEFLVSVQIHDTIELRNALSEDTFKEDIRGIHGVGPKTVDYMACLVGADCIAVDRHIRGFASCAGIEHDEYDYLKDAFCFAADLLDISRREFDAWVWNYQSERSRNQLVFNFI